jgi:hypothetical protein
MNTNWKILIVFTFFFVGTLTAQKKPEKQEVYIAGYAEKVAGNEIKYTSGIDGIDQALITRASTGKQSMVWNTSPVQYGSDNSFVTFISYVGYDSRTPGTAFKFFVNKTQKGIINLPDAKLNEWSLSLEDKSELYFKKHFSDGNNDVFGFLYYKVPINNLKKGEALQLEITGANADELTWFMVFKKNLSQSINAIGLPTIQKNDGKEYQSILVEINYLKYPTNGKLSIDGIPFKDVNIETGLQSFQLMYPVVTQDKKIEIQLSSVELNLSTSIVLKPIRKWNVNFVQHSHTDIGYTRSQMEILAEHLRYIDYALDYCDATDDFPESSKFRWTCEASWAVDEYLNSRPKSQIDRLKQRVKEGRIEVTGMYFNFSELPDEQTLVASLAPIKSITEKGIPVTSAMQNDVNGIGWCMNDYFNTIDIKYLNMGTHGHKALISFDTPMAFWWVSPSGKKMLAFRAEHYMIGNTAFGVHLKDFENFERSLLRYLIQLDTKKYPYNRVAIQHSGFLTDNSPPSIMASNLIKQWNEKYEWPKIETAVVSDFFKDIERNHGNDLVEIKAHWPDWWTDGFASGAREVAAARNAHVEMIASQGGLAMAKLLGAKMPKGIKDRIMEANKALLFYGEHTFGAAESISDPYGEASMEQREVKESYAWEAYRRSKMISEEALGLLNEFISKEAEPSLIIYNTLNWKRDGLVTLFIDYQQVPAGKKMELVDDNGKKYPAQILKRWHGGAYWSVFVNDIPSFGFKKFIIKIKNESSHLDSHTSKLPHEHNPSPIYSEMNNQLSLDNDWYSITLDKNKGTVSQLYDKELRKTLIDENATYSLGEFILEKLGSREQLQSQMLPNGSRFGHLTDYSRSPLDSVWLSAIEEGDIWNTIQFKGTSETTYEASDAFTFEIRMYKTTKRIDFTYALKKKPILSPESFYIAFPFDLKNGKIHLEVAGGTMEAGVDQIPGSANDWNTIQNFVTVKNEKEQIVLVSHEAPIMQFGNINTGRFKYKAVPDDTHIYSWPMNNYWTTNFNADQRGMFTWTYNFTSLANSANQEATKFSWQNRIPFLARVIPKGVKEKPKQNEISILSGIPKNVLLISATPLEKENAVLFHFREVGNKSSSFLPINLLRNNAKWHQTNVLGNKEKEIELIEMDPLESKFYKLTW